MLVRISLSVKKFLDLIFRNLATAVYATVLEENGQLKDDHQRRRHTTKGTLR